MKVLFVGPTLATKGFDPGDCVVRGPARHGDMISAWNEGSTVIGLVDGYFGETAAVWHKEILFLLDAGVMIFGASSMGALRAAECAAFGMIPIGGIAHDYLDGRLIEDGDVAVTSLPEEFGHTLLTEPLVNVRATLANLRDRDLYSAGTLDRVRAEATAIHFSRRDVEFLAKASGEPAAQFAAHYRVHHVDRKAADALELIDRLKSTKAAARPKNDFGFRTTPLWRQMFPKLHNGAITALPFTDTEDAVGDSNGTTDLVSQAN